MFSQIWIRKNSSGDTAEVSAALIPFDPLTGDDIPDIR
jgi:hypothetical protein